MASITFCKEAFERRRSRESEDGICEYTQYFKVSCDSTAITPLHAQYADLSGSGGARIPRKGELVATVDGRQVRVAEVIANPIDEDMFQYEVYVRSTSDQGDFDPNPLLQRAVLDWGFVVTTEPVYQDINLKPITTSAGESFDPPPTMEFADPVLRIAYNTAGFDPGLTIDYELAANADNWPVPRSSYVAPKGSAKIRNWSGSQAIQNGVEYWQQVIEIQFRAPLSDGTSGFITNICDEGFIEVYPNKPTFRRVIRDDDGLVKNTPTKLNGAGGKLNAEVVDPTTGAIILAGSPAVYRKYQLFKTRPFGPLGWSGL